MCAKWSIITEAQSDQRLRCAVYGYLVRVSSDNCVLITQIDMLIRNFVWRTFDFFRNFKMCLNKSIAIYNVCPVLTLYIWYDPSKNIIRSPLSKFNISIGLKWKCLLVNHTSHTDRLGYTRTHRFWVLSNVLSSHFRVTSEFHSVCIQAACWVNFRQNVNYTSIASIPQSPLPNPSSLFPCPITARFTPSTAPVYLPVPQNSPGRGTTPYL